MQLTDFDHHSDDLQTELNSTQSYYQLINSELTQQDGRGKKTANLVWQVWR